MSSRERITQLIMQINADREKALLAAITKLGIDFDIQNVEALRPRCQMTIRPDGVETFFVDGKAVIEFQPLTWGDTRQQQNNFIISVTQKYRVMDGL